MERVVFACEVGFGGIEIVGEDMVEVRDCRLDEGSVVGSSLCEWE